MAQIALTDVKIRKMKPDAKKRLEVWDAIFPGFGVRVSPAGTKSFLITPTFQQHLRSTAVCS